MDGLAHFTEHARSIPLTHTLHTRTDANVNHARLNLVGNLDDGHETRGTLSVDSVDTGGVWDSGDEGGCACDGGTTAGRADCSDGDVFDEGGVDARRLDNSLDRQRVITNEVRLWGLVTWRMPASMSSGKESLKPPFPARVIAVLRADTMTTYRSVSSGQREATREGMGSVHRRGSCRGGLIACL
jgi:hypothetical protein